MSKMFKNEFEKLALMQKNSANIYIDNYGERTVWDLIHHTVCNSEYYNSWLLPSNYGAVALKAMHQNAEVILIYFFKFSASRQTYHIIKDKREMPESLLRNNIGPYNNMIRNKNELKEFIKKCKTVMEEDKAVKKFK